MSSFLVSYVVNNGTLSIAFEDSTGVELLLPLSFLSAGLALEAVVAESFLLSFDFLSLDVVASDAYFVSALSELAIGFSSYFTAG